MHEPYIPTSYQLPAVNRSSPDVELRGHGKRPAALAAQRAIRNTKGLGAEFQSDANDGTYFADPSTATTEENDASEDAGQDADEDADEDANSEQPTLNSSLARQREERNSMIIVGTPAAIPSSSQVEFVSARRVIQPPQRLMQTSIHRYTYPLDDFDSESDAGIGGEP